MKNTLIAAALFAGMLTLCADTIEEWNFKEKAVRGIRMDKNHIGYTPDAEKTPDGESAGAFKVIVSPKPGVSYGLQIGFVTNKPFVTGTKYKISFYAKATEICDIVMGCMQSKSPYKPVGPTVSRKVTKEWKKVTAIP